MRVAQFRAALRMVLSRAARVRVPLADVVEERREKERPRARHLGGEAGGERILVRELAAAQRAEAVERGDRVNVDRVHMVHVVVNAPRHRGELRDHREQEPTSWSSLKSTRAGARLGHRAHELDEQPPASGDARSLEAYSEHVGR